MLARSIPIVPKLGFVRVCQALSARRFAFLTSGAALVQAAGIMDAGTKAAAEGVVSALSKGNADIYTRLLSCVRGRCQQAVTKCVGKSGPCDQRASMRAARAECRPLRESVMAAAREGVCVPYVERMRPALLRQCGGDASLLEARVAELTHGCAAAEAKKDARLGDCVAAAFRDAQAECAARECRGAVAACAVRLCDVHVPGDADSG